MMLVPPRVLMGVFFAGLLAATVFQSSSADSKPITDWPVFRGNALQTGVAISTLPEQLEIRWKFKTKDSVEATAAIANGTVYVGSFDENLYALDLATGQQKWVYKAGPIKSPVSVRAGSVYAGNADNTFHCVDAATGKKQWAYETEAPITSGSNFAGDAVLFGCDDETLYCLSGAGKERWKFKVPGGPVMGTPAVIDNRTFAAGCDSTLHVIDTATGKEVGNGVDLGGQVGASVAVVGERLYIGTMSSQVLGIDWKERQVVWAFEATSRRQPFYASAAVTDALVIVGGRDKHVYALDRKTGKEAWNFATRNRVDSSPVIVGQRVFVGSQDGNLYVLDVAKGTELKRFELGSPISASPAVAENCLVIGTNDGTVYCLGAKN